MTTREKKIKKERRGKSTSKKCFKEIKRLEIFICEDLNVKTIPANRYCLGQILNYYPLLHESNQIKSSCINGSKNL